MRFMILVKANKDSEAGVMPSEHLYNITNIGLNIHSDMLCDISRRA